MGAKYNTFGPIGRETAIVIGVKVGEEVRYRVISSMAKGVDGEAGFGNVFGLRKCGWKRRKEKWGWRLVTNRRLSCEEKIGGV